MGGVSIRSGDHLIKSLTPNEGIPSTHVNCIRLSPDGLMWVGTNMGVVRFAANGTHSLRFSQRWLTDNKVLDIAFDIQGNAWLGTAHGVSEIKRTMMTLEDKKNNFYGL